MDYYAIINAKENADFIIGPFESEQTTKKEADEWIETMRGSYSIIKVSSGAKIELVY